MCFGGLQWTTFPVWMKEWLTPQSKRLLELQSHELRFGWHAYLWYHKVKINVDLKNHFVRTILRVLYEIFLWVSPQQVCFRKEMFKPCTLLELTEDKRSAFSHTLHRVSSTLLQSILFSMGMTSSWISYLFRAGDFPVSSWTDPRRVDKVEDEESGWIKLQVKDITFKQQSTLHWSC